MDHDAILDVHNFLLLLLIPCSLFPLLEPHCLGWFSCGCSLNLYYKEVWILRGIAFGWWPHISIFFSLRHGNTHRIPCYMNNFPLVIISIPHPTPEELLSSLPFGSLTWWVQRDPVKFQSLFFLLFLVAYLLIDFREKASEWERKGEKHWCERETVSCCLLYMPTGDQTHQPGMCPDQELNQSSLTLQDDAPPTKSYSLIVFFICSDRGLNLQPQHIGMTL